MEEKNRLSECEEMVMSVLWSTKEDLNLNQVTEQVNAKFGKDWKIQTVCTFLTRLEKKEFISIYRIGRYSYYRTEVSKDEYRKIMLENVAAMLFDGDYIAIGYFVLGKQEDDLK